LTRSSIETLLVVEDDLLDAQLLRGMLGAQDLITEVTHVWNMREAEEYLTVNAVDLILLDLGLPDARGLGAVRRMHAVAPHTPLVVLTGLDDESLAALAMHEGAQDYLVKGEIDARGLVRALRYAVERKLLEEALHVERERAVTLNSLADAVAATDLLGRISFLNAAGERVTGWSQRQALGRPIGDVLRIVDAASREPIANLMQYSDDALARSSNWLLLRQDGAEIPIEESVAAILSEAGQVIGAVMVFRDVSAGRAVATRISHAAEHDFLTGLPNRMLLNDRVTEAILLAARHTKKVGLLFLDLDGFKQINDSLGHPVGDRLLKSVATRLVQCVRASDTVSRQGGDEFVVLLSEMESAEDAAVIANKLLQAVSRVHSIDQQDLHVTTSIGASVYPDDGLDAETLIKNADTAMYQAKEQGRERYQFFTPAMNVRAVEREFIEAGLRLALTRGEFTLEYQPKVDLKTRRIVGAEALIRWVHPIRGRTGPSEFLTVAEDSGLIVPIGRWVLREACREARGWMDAGLTTITVSVNVSAKEFLDKDFLTGLFAALSDEGLPPESLELDLTERALMTDAGAAEGVLAALRARGVRVAVDDFGTGYSSLSHLRRFTVDYLKIDRSFVRQILAAPYEPIVSAIINIGRSLNLRVVAEGVEEREEASFLEAHRCHEAQGPYFSRPLPSPLLSELLLKGLADSGGARRSNRFDGAAKVD
jgi:diguanylate cyclase (GGDEF)-like protein/PAS domain S-box-containing protein